jgi:plastocyanin
MSLSRVAAAAALASLFTAPAAAQQAPVVTVTLANFSFGPKPIQLAAGKPVTLTFVNQAGSGHDFTAREFFAASTITAGGAPDGKVELAGHETKSVTLIPRAGTYQVHCSHFLHASMGMTDTIVVQ